MINPINFKRVKTYQNYKIICSGNSLVNGVADNPSGTNFPTLLSVTPIMSRYSVPIINMGYDGISTPSLSAQYTSTIHPLYDSSKKNVMIFWEATNDIKAGSSAAQALANYQAYCNTARADGFKVIVLNTIPRNEARTNGDSYIIFNQILSDFNTLLASNWQNFSDGMVDLRSNSSLATVGADACWGSSIHLVTKGYQIVSNMVLQKLNSTKLF